MKKLFKKIFIYLPLLLIFIIGLLYFIITSGFFLKYVGLPLAGTLIGMPIRVEKINASFLVNPHLDVRGLVFGYPDKPFITGKKVSAGFDLLSLFKGDIRLSNVSIDGLDISMLSDKNEKWNVCWMNETHSSDTSKDTSDNIETSSSFPMQLDIAGASIRNVNFTLNTQDDIKVVLKNFNIYSDSFKNQKESNVKIKGDIKQFTGKNVAINNGKIDTALKASLNKEYFPTSLQLDSLISGFSGIIKGKAVSDKSFKINALLNPEDKNVVNISNISINEHTNNTLSSSLSLKGKVILEPFSFNLNISADPIGSDSINLVSNLFLHTDMGNDASLVFKGNVGFENNILMTRGDLKLEDLLFQSPVSSAKKELISAALKYDTTIDFSGKRIDIKQLEVAVDRENNALMNIFLQKPMAIDWKNEQIKVFGEDPEIVAKISNLKLSIFNEFLPDGAKFSSGTLNSNLKLKLSAINGTASVFGNINLSDASYVSPNFNVRGINLNQALNLNLGNMKNLALNKYYVTLTQNNQKLLELSLNGKYDLKSGTGELRTSIPYYSIEIINLLPDSVLSGEDKKQIISGMSPFNFSITNKQIFSVSGSIITIKDFLLALQTEKNGTISFAMDKDVNLDLNGKYLFSEDLPLKVKIVNFGLKKLNGFLPANTKIESGKINMTADLTAGNTFEKISASGTLNIADMAMNIEGNTIPEIGIGSQFNTSLENDLLKLNTFSIFVRTTAGEKLSAKLSAPAVIDFRNNRDSGKKMTFNTRIENLDLRRINGFLASDIKFQKGILNLQADAVAEKDFKKISASGVVLLSDVNGNIKGNILSKTGLSSKVNLIYDDTGAFAVSDTIIKIFYGNNDAANISLNGNFNKGGMMNLDTQFKTNEYLLRALNKTSSEYERIGAFLLDGSLKLKTAKESFSLDGNINIPKLTMIDTQSGQSEQINGVLDISIYKDSHCLNIKSGKLNLYSNNSNICDLASDGKIIFSDNVQSTFEMTSEKIDLKKVLHICDLLLPSTGEINVAEKKTITQSKEPAPIDLKGINLKGNISFNDIEYGPYIHMAITSNLVIKNNIISLLPLFVKMNRGELKSNIYINSSFADGYTYEVKSQLRNLDINPLLKTFIQGNYSDTKGTISFLRFYATGKGITSPNLLNNMDGSLSAACNNISLPLDISQNKFMALFLMPIQIISNISQQLPNTPLPSDLNQAMKLTGNIISQRKNINFQSGDIMLSANNKIINVEKFCFIGGQDDIIKTMKFKGTIGPENKLNLRTNTNFGKLDIPLNFNGTVENPSPDIPVFIAGFITKNTVNILDMTQDILNKASGPQGGDETTPVQQLGNGVLNTAKGILSNLTGP